MFLCCCERAPSIKMPWTPRYELGKIKNVFRDDIKKASPTVRPTTPAQYDEAFRRHNNTERRRSMTPTVALL